jgi:DNA-binding beta-propeller fold protein YncE
MYVALANRDAVAAVNIGAGQFSVKGYFDTRLPGQSYFGAEPEALAINADGSRLYVANAITDAVAVIDTTKLTPRSKAGHGRADWICTHRMDADVDGFLPGFRRQAVCRNGQG